MRVIQELNVLGHVPGEYVVLLDSRRACQVTFGVGRIVYNYQHTSQSVVVKPVHGALVEKPPGFIYTAGSTYKGDDSFTLRLCGKTLRGSGCENSTYRVSGG